MNLLGNVVLTLVFVFCCGRWVRAEEGDAVGGAGAMLLLVASIGRCAC